ncbi:biliverdin-producing heme oxygenase [Rubrolithibacter danxiaensis]|uniref:biliverdin-producing heme oxygenase n=1 Tax=Rubrolithibacter danxiaensis TaxID=3390805 RepID=UPI003BF7ABFF
MVSSLLKQFTTEVHLNLEKKLISKIKLIRSAKDYSNILQIFYGYFGPLEKKIDEYLDKEILPDYLLRRKSAAILYDLKTLNIDISNDAAINEELPQIDNSFQALGALYVLEGSTLGGKTIAKMIESTIGISNSLTFFKSYGNDTMSMWNIFKSVLNNLDLTEPQRKEVLISAKDTFIKFENWIEKNDSRKKL